MISRPVRWALPKRNQMPNNSEKKDNFDRQGVIMRRMTKRGVLALVLTCFLVSAVGRAEEERKPKKLLGPYVRKSAPGPYTPKPGPTGVIPCGNMFDDCYLFADKDNDKYIDIKYYYTPMLQFLRDPETNRVLISEPVVLEGDKVAAVNLILVREDETMIKDMLDYISAREHMPLNRSNLDPLPWQPLQLAVSHPMQFPVDVSYSCPSENTSDTDWCVGASFLVLNFEIPVEYVPLFIERMGNGTWFDIRWAYETTDIQSSYATVDQRLSIDQKLKQDFFGERNNVWATREQLLDFVAQINVRNQAKIYVEDERVFNSLYSHVDRLLNEISSQEKTLGQMVREDVMTNYRLNRDDPYLMPNYTTSANDTFSESLQRHEQIKDFYEKWRQKRGGGGFGFFGIKLGGGGAGASGETKDYETMSDYVRDKLSHQEWQGFRLDTLNQKIYNVQAVNLERKLNSSLEIVSADPSRHGTTWKWMGTKRNTLIHTLNVDEQQLAKIMRNYRSVPLPHKGDQPNPNFMRRLQQRRP